MNRKRKSPLLTQFVQQSRMPGKMKLIGAISRNQRVMPLKPFRRLVWSSIKVTNWLQRSLVGDGMSI